MLFRLRKKTSGNATTNRKEEGNCNLPILKEFGKLKGFDATY
jgi:hypothetical protein